MFCTPPLTYAQQAGCSSSFTNTSVAALIASNYQNDGQGPAPTIVLHTSPAGFTFRVVCLSSSGLRNQYRFVSIVAYFTTSQVSVSPAGVPLYGQFEFECVGSSWSASSPLLDNALFCRTYTPAAINASIRTDCAYCLKGVSALSPPRSTDSINHCSGELIALQEVKRDDDVFLSSRVSQVAVDVLNRSVTLGKLLHSSAAFTTAQFVAITTSLMEYVPPSVLHHIFLMRTGPAVRMVFHVEY